MPELPKDPAHYVRCIAEAGYFEAITFTREDLARADQYAANLERAEMREAAGGMEDGVKQLLSGGPMMGMAISRTDIPVTKGCSGVLCLGREAVEPNWGGCSGGGSWRVLHPQTSPGA